MAGGGSWQKISNHLIYMNTNENENITEEETFPQIEWTGDKLDASDILYQRGATYGMYVIKMRALPDARDGLKNVHRRIIWGMSRLGLYYDKPYKKSAQATGKIMGSYHPHGDSSIYDAMGLMAQPFSTNVPLVDGQGNWGSVDGDSLAAARYTEARLTRVASDWLKDCKETIVPFQDNFAEDEKEPTIMTVDYPNLVVNGTSGIAWGVACNFPSHNIGETIDATILLLDNPNATLKQVMKKLPGPDFPAGAVITNPEALEDIYKTGKGKIVLQSKMHIDQFSRNQKAVVITEMPPGIKPTDISLQIADGAQKGKITQVVDKVINNLDKDGLKFIVRCKKGGNPDVLVEELLAHTKLRYNFHVNMTALEDGAPKTFGLIGLLQAWIDFRIEVVEMRLKNEYSAIINELSRLDAQRAALDAIDRVIKIIRTSKDNADTKAQLIKLLKVKPYGEKRARPIDEAQAQYIMDMRLAQLNQLNQFDLDEKIKSRRIRLGEIEKILATPEMVRDIIKEELKEIKKREAQKRRTLVSADFDNNPVSEIEATPVQLWIGSKANVACTSEKYNRNVSPLSADNTVERLHASNLEEILLHTSQGNVYRGSVRELPIEDKKSKGKQWVSLASGEEIVACTRESSAKYLLWVSEDGSIKRMEENLVSKSASSLASLAFQSKGEKVICVLPHGEGEELLVHTKAGKALRIDIDKVNPVKSLSAGGVALMKLSAEDKIVSASLVKDNTHLLILHDNGYGKLVDISEYPQKGRGTQGVASADPTKPASNKAGNIAGAWAVGKGEYSLLSKAGVLIEVDTKKIAPTTRATVSKAIVKSLVAGDSPLHIV